MRTHAISRALYCTLFIIPFFFLTSCDKDEIELSETIFDSETTQVYVDESDDFINITVESLLSQPFIIIAVDQNNNNEIDSLVDVIYAFHSDFETCTSYIIRADASTGCGEFDSDAILTVDRDSTEFSSEIHSVFELQLPKDDLSDSGMLSFYAMVYGGKYFYYPANPDIHPGHYSFENTFKVQWK